MNTTNKAALHAGDAASVASDTSNATSASTSTVRRSIFSQVEKVKYNTGTPYSPSQSSRNSRPTRRRTRHSIGTSNVIGNRDRSGSALSASASNVSLASYASTISSSAVAVDYVDIMKFNEIGGASNLGISPLDIHGHGFGMGSSLDPGHHRRHSNMTAYVPGSPPRMIATPAPTPIRLDASGKALGNKTLIIGDARKINSEGDKEKRSDLPQEPSSFIQNPSSSKDMAMAIVPSTSNTETVIATSANAKMDILASEEKKEDTSAAVSAPLLCQPVSPTGSTATKVSLEKQLFHQLHNSHVKSPSIKEFNECWAFCKVVKSFFKGGKGKSKGNRDISTEFDVVIDVAGGHGALAALFLITTHARRAVVIDPADVGQRGVERAWGEFYKEDGKKLVFRHECLRTGLRDELDHAIATMGVSPQRVLVIACHACQHLTDETLEIACSYGVHAAVMPCCQKDLTGGSWKATGKSLGIGIETLLDVLVAGKVMSWTNGERSGVSYQVRMKTIDAKITPQNRVILCRALEASTPGALGGLGREKNEAHAKLERAYKKAHARQDGQKSNKDANNNAASSKNHGKQVDNDSSSIKEDRRINDEKETNNTKQKEHNSNNKNRSRSGPKQIKRRNMFSIMTRDSFCIKSAAIGIAVGFLMSTLSNIRSSRSRR